MSDTGERDELTPAEERLLDYIEALRRRPPHADAQVVPTIVRAARWQALARPYLVAVGGIGGALSAAAGVLLGSTRRT
jgi:hypothetical protein